MPEPLGINGPAAPASATPGEIPAIALTADPPYWEWADPRPADLDDNANRKWGGEIGPVQEDAYPYGYDYS